MSDDEPVANTTGLIDDKMEVARVPKVEALTSIDPAPFLDEAGFLFSWPKERDPEEVTMKIESITSSGLLTIGLSEEIAWPVYAKSILFGFANNGEERTLTSNELDETYILQEEAPPC